MCVCVCVQISSFYFRSAIDETVVLTFFVLENVSVLSYQQQTRETIAVSVCQQQQTLYSIPYFSNHTTTTAAHVESASERIFYRPAFGKVRSKYTMEQFFPGTT